ncbi:DUF1292 domain-containing protein [Butyrivibrio sp. YAB3001]|uniref:DUF1292 domain-containing protein n=1 Tax=Butyrivibrio sp. YAB3001 TaxID=1520812 RepID=UPI0008F62A24|nr:DUF1292 domain-containing protein [Butyrivibrio sp. YAB3001]SFB68038.1 Protein of unknown function [Butyrivibrio sp. YAB3001]
MEFSKVATDMNTKIENGDQTTVDIELDNNETVTCAIIIVLTVNSKDYIVLLPLDKNGQNEDGNVWFYEFIYNGEDADPDLGYISDDDEYEAVSEAFNLYLDDVEFDEIVELPEEGLDGEEE